MTAYYTDWLDNQILNAEPAYLSDSQPVGALAPYSVLDLTGEIGQICGRTLAELGALVVKVEPPGGDPVRSVGPFLDQAGPTDASLLWQVLNLNKLGITLDLDHPDGPALLSSLISQFDLVIDSFQPGYLTERGISFEALSQVHPKLVWLSITGFGQEGPYRDYVWSDLVGLALGGQLNLWGDEDRPPVQAAVAQAYYAASQGAAVGAVAALYHARKTGCGQFVDASMQELVSFTAGGPGGITCHWPMLGRNITRSGPALRIDKIRTRILYECRDGYVAMASPWSPTKMPKIVKAMARDGAAGFLEDPKWAYATRSEPIAGMWQCTPEDAEAVEALIGDWVKRYSRDELLGLAEEFGLMIFPVRTVAENLQSEQLRARNFFQTVHVQEPDISITVAGPPVRLSLTPASVRSRAPQIGEHNALIYGRAGLNEANIEALASRGVI